jgi:hypothetical protein
MSKSLFKARRARAVESAVQSVVSQHVHHLDFEEVWHVQALVRPIHPLPDARRVRTEIQQHGVRRGVEDDHGRLAEVAGLVGVPHPTDDHLRRLV